MDLEEAKKILLNSYPMTTKHDLDDENKANKEAIQVVLEELSHLRKENEKMNNKIIEEIEILKQHKNNNSSLDYTHNDLMDCAIAALEELLEEE